MQRYVFYDRRTNDYFYTAIIFIYTAIALE